MDGSGEIFDSCPAIMEFILSLVQMMACRHRIVALAWSRAVIADHLAIERPQAEPGTPQSNLLVTLFGLGGRNELRDF